MRSRPKATQPVCAGEPFRQADVQAASEEVLVIVIRTDRQGAVLERQAGADLEFELEGALEGGLLAELADEEGVVGALHPVCQANLLQNRAHALAGQSRGFPARTLWCRRRSPRAW